MSGLRFIRTIASARMDEPSPLEMAEVAHMAARSSWLWPEDEELRQASIEACSGLGVDYLEALARTVELTGTSIDLARREVAEALRRTADRVWQGTIIA